MDEAELLRDVPAEPDRQLGRAHEVGEQHGGRDRGRQLAHPSRQGGTRPDSVLPHDGTPTIGCGGWAEGRRWGHGGGRRRRQGLPVLRRHVRAADRTGRSDPRHRALAGGPLHRLAGGRHAHREAAAPRDLRWRARARGVRGARTPAPAGGAGGPGADHGGAGLRLPLVPRRRHGHPHPLRGATGHQGADGEVRRVRAAPPAGDVRGRRAARPRARRWRSPAGPRAPRRRARCGPRSRRSRTRSGRTRRRPSRSPTARRRGGSGTGRTAGARARG